jgi:hypothetical protein
MHINAEWPYCQENYSIFGGLETIVTATHYPFVQDCYALATKRNESGAMATNISLTKQFFEL